MAGDLTVAVVGSVDAGKSTLVGVLTQQTLDDGQGQARQVLFNYPHERASGRTSSIGQAHMIDGQRRITFVDLCGHATYTKTTVRGLTAYRPDVALVCVGSHATAMTREHLRLLVTLHIPFLFVITKLDQTPAQVMSSTVTVLRRLARDCGKRLFEVGAERDLEVAVPGLATLVPCLRVSNVTGENLATLRTLLSRLPTPPRRDPPVFFVQSVYKVAGVGTVVAGYTGVDIHKGDTLYIGPGPRGEYIQTRVRGLHNDYREPLLILPAHTKGCLHIQSEGDRRGGVRLRPGLILTPTPQPVYKRFRAELVVVRGHHTTLRPDYRAFCHCGPIREPVRLIQAPSVLRSGDRAVVEIEFVRQAYFLTPDMPILLREGTLKAYAQMVPETSAQK